MDVAPVVVFVYNRLNKIKYCLEELEKNKECNETDIIIFSDGAKTEEDKKKVSEVRSFLKDEYWPACKFKSITIMESSKNKGLANSIIDGVTSVINRFGKVIVVEDDLIVSNDFLRYMNGALDFYENKLEVGSISAYTCPLRKLKKYKHDIFFTRKGECWGWGTWKNRWEKVDWTVSTFDEYKANALMRKEFSKIGYGLDTMLCDQMSGLLDSWAVRWCYHLYRNHLWTVYPCISRVNNIGFDGSGVHCGSINKFENEFIGSKKVCKFEMLNVSRKLEKAYYDYESGKQTFLGRVIEYLRSE